ncbi:YhdP family protein [Aliamphritea hakodatensis]|uniref:YhdP family protein n=1 Tax=Aliamphritea hakodatensis TaxID=2895352 RepID=UPI0022FD9B4D|nr:YhdP family protein [Aliamphritea hakodatensis]
MWLLKTGVRWLNWLVLAVLLLLVIAMLAIRQMMPLVSDYREDISSYLSRQLNAEISMQQISADWDGRYPRLYVSDLQARLPDENLDVQVQSLDLSFNFVASLLRGEPLFQRIDVRGVQTRVILPADLGAEVPVAPGSGLQTEVPQWLTLLLNQPRIYVSDSQILLQPSQGDAVAVQLQSAQLENTSEQHQLSVGLELAVAGEPANTLRLVLESNGLKQTPAVDFYVQANALSTGLLDTVRRLLPGVGGLNEVDVEQLDAGISLWGRWSNGAISRLRTRMDIRSLLLEQPQPVHLEDFTADLVFSEEAGLKRLRASHLEGVLDSARLRINEAVLQQRHDSLRFTMPEQNLGRLEAWLLQQSFIPQAVRDEIALLALQGNVRNIQVDWPVLSDADPEGGVDLAAVGLPAFSPLDFAAVADLDRVGFNGYEGAPAMQGVDGRLELAYQDDELNGRIDLASDDLGLFFPEEFNAGWRFDYARGTTFFHLKEQVLTLSSDLVRLRKEGINASGRWSLYLPLDPEIRSELTLLIGIKDADGRLAPTLIPHKELSDELNNWVTAAVKQGQVTEGSLLLHTNTRSAFSDEPQVVQLFLDVKGGTIDYDPNWPAVTGTDATMLMREEGLEIYATGGQLKGSALEQAWVYLPPGTETLRVLGWAQGDAGNIQDVLLGSNIFSEPVEELQQWRVTGQAKTAVNLNLPLDDPEAVPDVDVAVDLSAGQLSSDARQLSLSGLVGRLNYNQRKGLSSPSLKGQIFGEPFSATILSRNTRQGTVTSTTLNSRVELKKIQQWTGETVLSGMQGRQAYTATLDICATASCSKLQIESDLKDTELSFFAPLNKPKGERLPSRFSMNFAATPTLTFNLGQRLAAAMVLRGEDIERAKFDFGTQKTSLPAQPGYSLSGYLDRLNIDELQQFLSANGLVNETSPAPGGTASASPAALEAIAEIDMTLSEVSFGTTRLKDVRLELQDLGEQRRISLHSSAVQGSLTISDNRPYLLDLAYIDLDALLPEDAGDNAAEAPFVDSAIRPGQLPAANVKVGQLVYHGKRWGEWGFSLRTQDGDSVFSDLYGRMDQLNIKGDIRWSSGTPSQSELRLSLRGDNVGQSLMTAGYQKVLETREFRADTKMFWSGAPWQFSLGRVRGGADFVAEEGRLIESGTSSNFLRIFGILNLNTLGRRLRLDFKDLFAKGVSFDVLKGRYRIENGIASSVEPLTLDGPSADVQLTGDIDLVTETLNTEMQVTLPVTDNLPIAAALLGAPQIAGAAFIIDKLFGDEIKEKVAAVRYRMQGDWGDPQFELITSGKDRTQGVVEN